MKNNKAVTIKTIERAVANYNGLDVKTMYSKCRKREIVYPRQTVHYFIKKLRPKKETLAKVGERCGKVSYSSVLNSTKTIKNLLETDKTASIEIEEMEKMILYNTNIQEIEMKRKAARNARKSRFKNVSRKN